MGVNALEAEQTLAQRRYADTILAYRLAQQQVERLTEAQQAAAHMADVLRARMEEARRGLTTERRGPEPPW